MARDLRARAVLRRAMAGSGVIPPGTLYFRFYLVQAAKRCGLRDLWFDILPQWESCLKRTGLTTQPSGQVLRAGHHRFSMYHCA